MAFNIQRWAVISGSTNNRVVTLQDGGTIGAPNVFTYISATDTTAQIAGINYFADVVVDLSAGDLIYGCGTDGRILLGVISVDVYKKLVTTAAIVNSGTVLSVTGTPNQIDSTGGTAPVLSLSNTVIAPGSVAVTSLTANAAVVSNATKTLTSVPMVNGQLLVGSTGNAPVAASLTAGTGITITPGSGSITIASTATGSGQSVTKDITQVAHGFTVQQLVYLVGSVYTLALGTSAAAAEVIGIVSAVIDANNFTITTNGYVPGLSGLTAGEVYWLSDVTPGLLTATIPTAVGSVQKPLLVADSATSGYFENLRGDLITPITSFVESVSGTPNQIDSSGGANVTLSLPAALIAPGTLKVGNITLSGSDIFCTNQLSVQPQGGTAFVIVADTRLTNGNSIILNNVANTFASSFRATAQASNAPYILPPALPAVSGYALSCTTGGVMSWAPGAIGAINIQVFTTSGTYTPTPGMRYCIIEAVGGGGGGGGSATCTASQASIGGGGGGGGYARIAASALTVGASQTVTIGAGGTGGAATGGSGGTGGTSSVGTLCIATGGNPGVGLPATTSALFAAGGGSSGLGSTGSVLGGSTPGGFGVASSTTTYVASGSGGGAIYGRGANSVVGTGAGAGGNGAGYGGGGSGGASANSNPGQLGGAGATGAVIVTEYI